MILQILAREARADFIGQSGKADAFEPKLALQRSGADAQGAGDIVDGRQADSNALQQFRTDALGQSVLRRAGVPFQETRAAGIATAKLKAAWPSSMSRPVNTLSRRVMGISHGTPYP